MHVVEGIQFRQLRLEIDIQAKQQQAYGHRASQDAQNQAEQGLKQDMDATVGPVWGF
jgi:hypothetical protein